MKKIISIFLCVVLLISVIPSGVVSVGAETSGYYTYTVENGEATITDCNTSISGNITIPSTLGGYPVTAIGYSAFYDCDSLRSVTIPDSVTEIGQYAFNECVSLESVVLSKSLITLGGSAFGNTAISEIEIPKSLTECYVNGNCYYDFEGKSYWLQGGPFKMCDNLKSVTFEKGTTEIATRLFAGCTGLEKITIPDTVTVIEDSSFETCLRLNEVTIGEAVTEIRQYAFNDCVSLESIEIPNSVTEIGQYAFNECVSLESVLLSKSLITLGGSAFGNTAISEIEIPKSLTECSTISGYSYDFEGKSYWLQGGPFRMCDNLKSVTFEKGTTEIATRLFAGCTGLEKITIPDTVTVIEDSSFETCLRLNEVTIPDSVTEIGQYAFNECVSLESVVLSKSLITLGGSAFGNTAISEIEIPKSLTECSTISGYGYDFEGKSYWLQGGPFRMCDNLKSVTFEKGTTEIATRLFAGCTGLEKITIPDTVTVIEDSSFETCLRLNEVTIGEAVTEIRQYAFNDCVSLESIEIPNSVTEIGQYAFNECVSLESVLLSKSLITLGGSAFGNTAISEIEIPKSLTECYVNGNCYYDFEGKSYWLQGGPFKMCDNLKSVTFEKGTTEIATRLFAGCTGLEKITIPDTVTVIEDSSFETCLRLNEVTIGEAVTEIRQYAFNDCVSLESIEIPDSVTEIGQYAFNDCVSLESIEIPDSVTEIHHYAFSYCKSLKNAKLSKNIKNIEYSLFENCSSLETISIPAKVESIGSYAFAGCTNLASVSFPNNSKLTEIHGYFFSDGKSLKQIIIPKNVKIIGAEAFANNKSLEKVIIPQSTKEIGEAAFWGCESLFDVVISDYSIKTIKRDTFKDCSSLAAIVLPKGLINIESQAFMNDTSLVSVTIPSSVTYIDSTAFSYPRKTKIFGKSGSCAERFAINGGFSFVSDLILVEGFILKDRVENITIDTGETYRAEFEIFPENANEVIVLTANNDNVYIDGHDIYAKYSGDTIITATCECGLTYQFNVHIRSTESIEIISNPTKMTYVIGEEFNNDGMIVQVNYFDGSSKIVEDYTITGFDSSVEGENTVTVNWRSSTSEILTTYSTTFTVNIVDPTPKLTGIFIDVLPDKLYYQLYEKLDITGMVVMGNYTDNSTREITDYTLSGYNSLKTGSQTVTVTYGDYTCTFTVLLGVEKTLIDVSIAKLPAKTKYFVGDNLSTTGLQLKLTYNDNSTTTVSSGYTTSDFDCDSEGTKTITVFYEGFSTIFTVDVEIPSIVISKKEELLFVGRACTLIATTNPSGQLITWFSSDNQIASVYGGVVTANSEGTAIITARFTNNGIVYEDTCIITVTDSELLFAEISIIAAPNKTVYYINDDFIADGIRVVLNYFDGSFKDVTKEVEYIGFDSSSIGIKTIIVTYKEFTTTFNVVVITPSINITSGESIDVLEYNKATISVNLSPENQELSWSSLNTSVATVENGVVKAVSKGTTAIIVRMVYNGIVYSDYCVVNVHKREHGDINGDYIVDQTDYQYIADIYTGKVKVENKAELCDMNGDGRFDIRDIIAIREIINA